MVEANPGQVMHKCTIKHFAIDEQHSFVQYSTILSEAAMAEVTGENDADAAVREPGKNKILIQCLDNSGSMSGSPIEALKIGAKLIGSKYFEGDQRPFEKFYTFVYNNNATGSQATTQAEYDQVISGIRAGGGTNFMSCFIEIEKIIAENPNLEDLVVIFITDGQDGYYSRNPEMNAKQEYEMVSARIKSHPKIKSKFLSVGFSRGHDATFMNKIANFGSDVGNFIFIDSYNEGWREELNQSLLDSLAIALESNSKVKYLIQNPHVGHEETTKAEINYTARDTEVVNQPQQEVEEVQAMSVDEEQTIFDVLLSHQAVVSQDLMTDYLKVSLVTIKGEVELLCEFETVHEPKPETLMQAKLQFAKKQMFDFIQLLQKQNKEERQEIYQKIKQIDQQIDADTVTIRKIKDKDVRASLMDAVLLFKKQTAAVYNIMSKDVHDQIDNLLIAQLNDVAYKAIRKAGVQKKLDERAIKNDELYKKLDAQLNAAHSKLNFDKIAAAQEAAWEQKLGACPMSQCNVVELMRQKDCMCLGIAIARSQATIQDPTKLVIKDVFPVYMSLDSFLESSIFNLKSNEDAAGGFDLKDEAKLAVGAGREEISGLIPLYLFREHWELAKRKVQPLFGFMCTLEVLGYTSSQFFIIPFLVLNKILKKSLEEPSEASSQILELVSETCQRMLASNATFKEQTVDALIAFLQNPASRTADVAPDLHVLTSQIWAWNSLPEEEKKVINEDPQAAEENKSITPEMMKRYSRFVIEEIRRRQLKRDSQPLSKTQILNLLVPNYLDIVNEYKAQVQTQIDQKNSSEGGNDQYAQYMERANSLRAQAQAAESSSDAAQNAAGQEEEKKAGAEEQKAGEVRTIADIVRDTIATSPWMNKIETSIESIKKFAQNQKALLKMLSDLEGRESPIEDILDVFGGHGEVLLAMYTQNALHPKNSNRTDAIKENKYVEIETLEQARAYLGDLVSVNLTNELRAAEQAIYSALAGLQTKADLKKLVESPDVFVAAVALSEKSFYEGRGDRTTFFKIILELNPMWIPDLARKLKLVVGKEFMGLKLYNDKLCSPSRVNNQMIHKLWLHCCRQTNTLSIQDMIAFQPHAEQILRMKDRHVDAEGRTTLNMEEYMAYRQSLAEQKKQEAKGKKAAKGKKNLF